MTDTDDTKSAFEVLLVEYNKRLELRRVKLSDIETRQREIDNLQITLRGVETELVELNLALTVFSKYTNLEIPELPAAIKVVGPKAEIAKLDFSVRSKTEAILREAYPKSMLSRQIRKKIGDGVHEKTVGTTLFRLKKAGVVVRQGRDWTYIPPEKRT